MRVLKTDEAYIFDEQKEAFKMLFKNIDLTKITFVGGVADYLNLREYFDLPLHDIDITYRNEAVLKNIIDTIGVERHHINIYEFNNMEVITSEIEVNNKKVHVDFFKHNSNYGSLKKSTLLGHEVQHSSFQTMKRFHNNQIAALTSEETGSEYDWKRLYKHSKKAALYNLVTYQEKKRVINE